MERGFPMKKMAILCGVLFCIAAGIGAYAAISRSVGTENAAAARVEQQAREAQYVRERDEKYRRLLEQGTRELYELKDARSARQTLEQALDTALDDTQRYQAWRWLAEVAGDTDPALRKKAGQQMAAIGKSGRERSEGLFVAAQAEEKLGAAREAVKGYRAAAAGYEKEGDFIEACRCLQYAADAALLPGLRDIRLCKNILAQEEKLLKRAEEGSKRDMLLYDLQLAKADIERREGHKEEAQRKFAEIEGNSEKR